MTAEKDRMFGLDVVRAGAVLLVVFHHTFWVTTPPAWIQTLGGLGNLGVESLLVLSGYLIGRGLLKKSKNGQFCQVGHLRQFYIKRWLRTFPPYFLFLFIMASLYPPFIGTLKDHAQYFFFLQNFAWNMPPFYAQSWTLSILEFFYLLFPLGLILSGKVFRNYLVRVLVPITVFLLIPLILRSLHPRIENLDEFEDSFRNWVIYRLDTPIAGVVIALIEGELPQVWAWLRSHSWLGLTALTASALYYLADFPYLCSSHWWQVLFLPVVSVTIALVFPLLCSWKDRNTPVHHAVKSVAQVSYSLYVSHMFALSIGLVFLIIIGVPHEQWIIAYLLFAPLVGIAAYITYRLAEEPFIRLRESKTAPTSYFQAWSQAVTRLVKNLRTPKPPASILALGPTEEVPTPPPIQDSGKIQPFTNC